MPDVNSAMFIVETVRYPDLNRGTDLDNRNKDILETTKFQLTDRNSSNLKEGNSESDEDTVDGSPMDGVSSLTQMSGTYKGNARVSIMLF